VESDAANGPPFPDQPGLRDIALAIEQAQISGEILDSDLRIVFISSEEAKVVGLKPSEAGRYYGKSVITRNAEDAAVWGVSEESGVDWWRFQAPIMRALISPGDTHYEDVFGPLAEQASGVEPIEPPLAWYQKYGFPDDSELRRTTLGMIGFLELLIHDADGRFLGILRLTRPAMPEALMGRLGRGDLGLFERMDQVREPARRQAAILFADLEASGEHSRRLSSQGYFRLISGLTDLIDSVVVDGIGIVGKHAGDGGSALFLVDDFDGSDSAAAAAAVRAARQIQAGAAELDSANEIQVNVGLHWGSTLMVGQVATRGRLEVTALGDQMNECARIESVATSGSILASKELIERLEPDEAESVGVGIEDLSYTPLAEIEGAADKAVRDAGSIPVARI
jgi:class 3 adenylate cyclase